jgi:pimeloyl-ACP methyl ester carboxylesterase
MRAHRCAAAAAILAAAFFIAPAQAETVVLEGALAPPGWTSSQLPLCQTENCRNIAYPNLLPSPWTVQVGVEQLGLELESQSTAAIATPPTVVGHSMGGEVIYAYLRDNPDASGTFISLGNPERLYGGQQANQTGLGLPADLTATVIDVARQYDGWADAPTDTSNFLAVLNAVMGGFLVHPFYNVDIYDPSNVTWQEGSVTYVLVPTATLPLLMPLQWFGIDTTALDAQLRPQIEAAYTRPVPVPDPTPAADAPATQPQTASVLVAGEPTVASDLKVSVTQNSLDSGVTAERPHTPLTHPKKVRKPERVVGVQEVRQPHDADATPKRSAEAPKKRDTPNADRKAERQAEKADKPKKHDG